MLTFSADSCADVNATGTDSALRPLGLGEVLDRAVTLCVKFFVPLSTINLVYAVPFAVVTYFATKDFQRVFALWSDLIQRGAATGHAAGQAEMARLLARGGGLNSWTVALLLMTLLVSPLATAALIEATASSYLGRPVTFAQAYRVGLARWWPLVGLNALYLVTGIVLYLAVALTAVFTVFALTFVTTALHGVGTAIAVVVGVVLGIAFLAFGVVATLALQVSYFTCVTERAGPVMSYAMGLSRVFRGVGFKRSLLAGAAFIAIAIAIATVSGAGQAILLGLLHSTVAGTAYATIVRIATAAFTTAFIGIFYFDLRVREEGLDLTLAAQNARAQVVEAT